MSKIDKTNCTVLDLPLKERLEIAKSEGLSLEEWTQQTRIELQEMEDFAAELDANNGVRPEGMTEEDVERFQKKVDSATH